IGNIRELAEEVDELADVDNGSAAPQAVVVEQPGMMKRMVVGLPLALIFLISVTFLTFFLLAFGDRLMRQTARFASKWKTKRALLKTSRQMQGQLSRYLGVVTVINILLGCAVALTMYFLGVPNPLLWGVMTAVFNFAPYLGAAASLAVLTVVGFTTFDSFGQAMLVPGSFFVLTTLEGQLITPSILGREMSLSPLVVFLSMLIWGWLWGIIGALLAVPMLCSVVVICDNLPNGRLLADFLRGGQAPVRDE
ncbi:MAG: AI-2E family transporter, partial [Gammaproteobacteria bacterium]